MKRLSLFFFGFVVAASSVANAEPPSRDLLASQAMAQSALMTLDIQAERLRRMRQSDEVDGVKNRAEIRYWQSYLAGASAPPAAMSQ